MYAFISVGLNVSINIVMLKNDFITWVFIFASAFRHIRLSRYMEIAEVL